MHFDYTHAMVPKSSALEMLYFNTNDSTLAIKFWSGATIKYTGFGSEDWDNLFNAMSKGAYYNQRIKGVFDSQHLGSGVVFHSVEKTEELDLIVNENASPLNVTINIYVNGDPEAIAKAVERLAPSIRAVQRRV
ncbi:hypothetical protein SEA_TOMAS_248 [Streptomyces phage Tomas]|uniref:KTSC domain-containing protein n=1 Tax=Streptomyces phage Tomas TaxID=2914443 RepID=A0AA49BU08_9CAUD|nr:hypothetical protein PP453_gp076 [Streptomyces phage Tomas]UMO76391.1 hypothetical protein SEA_TOMAS_248 [Streptomyces phage Tomas]